jgi:hypothetical protein
VVEVILHKSSVPDLFWCPLAVATYDVGIDKESAGSVMTVVACDGDRGVDITYGSGTVLPVHHHNQLAKFGVVVARGVGIRMKTRDGVYIWLLADQQASEVISWQGSGGWYRQTRFLCERS